MEKGIIIAGNIIVDALKDIDVYPEHSKLTTIRRVHKSMGGLVCNCAKDLAKIDSEMPISAVGVIGDDDYGKYIRSEFAKYPNISLDCVRVAGETSFTDAMCDIKNNTRTFFTYRGASDTLCPEDFDFTKLKGKILHAGYILLLEGLDTADNEYGTKMARVLATAKENGIKTSVDVVSEESDRYKSLVVPALKYTDYCTINETEAQRITGIELSDVNGKLIPEKVAKAEKALFEMGVCEWTVIHSRDASYGMDRDGNFETVPSIDIPRSMIKGTTGAGDAFCSGILYGAYRNMNISEAMKFATAVATISLTTPGASDGILSYEEILKFGEENKAKYGEVKLD
ncbi:MAG: carbohydrate kinase family protein [Clostridia bacterium]|nr:carbohydrate kinase family protein [Clostridia bacterium]